MPRFLTVVHQAVSKGCWQRYPDGLPDATVVAEQSDWFATYLSSSPSETMNNTSCGVSLAAFEPPPGFGMMVLTPEIALAKSVSVSLLQKDEVKQPFL